MSLNLIAAERQTLVADFVRAVNERDFERADRLLPELPPAAGPAADRAAAALHMQRQRWAEAARALSLSPAADAEAQLQRNLCRNLAAIKTHRPDAYRAIADVDLGDAYGLHATPSGRMTVVARTGPAPILLGNATDPAGAAQQAVKQLAPAMAKGDCIALMSVGDGYVLDAVARQLPELPLGRRQAIYLFEPDARQLLACLLLHDFTGPDGPIERPNVMWFVGPRWAEAFKLAVHTERCLPFPKVTIKQAIDARPIEAVLAQALESLGKMDAEAAREVDRHYGGLDAGDFATALAGRAGRAPRVLLVTTRFSSVLQYSTRDAADAFRQIGFDAQVLIEPEAHYGMTRLALRRALAEFKPDLIFQIDHHRFEHGNLFPPNIPFVNWIQDLLPHLMLPATGDKIGENDFVLTPSLQRWTDEFNYPPRQCLEFRKLTRVPARPTSWVSQPQRVAYVSNWSQTPGQIREELLHGLGGAEREWTDAACGRVIAVYDAGGSLASPGDVRRVVLEAAADGEFAAGETTTRRIASRLSDRLNNLLFRQQGIDWAVAACAKLDLKLELYGAGWADHARFGRFARGPIGYGAPLEALSRSTGIQLVLEPFVCVGHQRVLDTLAAGGLCAIRHTPAADALTRLLEILADVDPSHANRKAALDSLSGSPRQDALRSALAACDAADVAGDAIDPVANVRRVQRSGFLPPDAPLLPLYEQVAFATPAQLTQTLGRLLGNEELRVDVSRLQRAAVESRYGYAAGMRRVVDFVADRLQQRRTPLTRAA
ncbi:MAG TPA: hypothetical protein VF624_15480 [Tepidisphaeraceae bacterium]